MIKLLSWNVNGIRAVAKKGALQWLAQYKPDVLAMQETKAWPEQLDAELLAPAGYYSFFVTAQKKGYSGCAMYVKKKPQALAILGDEDFDNEGRVQIAHFKGFTLVNCYFPNAQELGRRLKYKLAFCRAIHKKVDELSAEGKPVILCGDYNIAHKPIDLARPKDNEKNSGYLPEERAWMDTFLASGYVDTFRHFCAEPEHFSWWSYRYGVRERNIGWRIDYHCINKMCTGVLKSASILPEVMGSDHCPVEVVLNLPKTAL
jgi:exodeoxyribonuclease-3